MKSGGSESCWIYELYLGTEFLSNKKLGACATCPHYIISVGGADPRQWSGKNVYSKEDEHCNTCDYKLTFASVHVLLWNYEV